MEAMKKSVKVVLQSLLIAIPLALLFLFLFQRFVDTETESALKRASKRNEIHLRYMEGNLQDFYRTISSTMDAVLQVAYDHLDLPDASVHLQNLFDSVASEEPLLNAIVLFDSERHERVRSSLCQTGSNPILHAMGLTVMDIVTVVSELSPEDLYVNSAYVAEDTAPEKDPHLYAVLVKGLYRDGKLEGMLLFSLKAVDTEKLYARYISTEESALDLSVCDGYGHVLETTDSSAPFLSGTGDVFDPELWKRVQGDEGAFIADGMFYKYLTVHPFRESVSHREGKRFLVLIASSTLQELPALQNTFIVRHENLKYLIAFILLAMLTLLFTFVRLSRSAREEADTGNIVSENTPEGVLIRNGEGRVTFLNSSLEIFTGFSEELMRQHPPTLHLLYSEEAEDEHLRKKRLKKIGKKRSDYDDFAWLEGNGYYLLIHLQREHVYSKRRLVSSVQLMSDTRSLTEESFDSFLLESSAAGAVDALPVSILETKGGESADKAVLYIKLTNLHLLEAHYTLVQHNRLEAEIRQALLTVLGDEDLLFQYSPDSFMIVLSLLDDDFDTRKASLDAVFSRALEQDGMPRPIRFQGGVTRILRGDARDGRELIAEARMALSTQFHYKGTGWLEYNREVHDNLIRYSTIVKKLPSALKEKKIEVYFQPIYRVMDDALLGGECLVRWQDEELGWIYPDEFIPIVESHRLDVELDRYVLERAMQYLSSLQLSDSDDFFLSVNICPRDFSNEQLIPFINTMLSRYSIRPQRLLLEITENTLLDDITLTNEVLRSLRNHQIRIAIDDFGTGYSSLSYLNQLEVDVIKIDREFIMKYPEEDDGKLIRSIMRMANDLSMTFYVEGIETQEQLALTRENKSFAYQGYLRSRPVPEEEFRRLCDSVFRTER